MALLSQSNACPSCGKSLNLSSPLCIHCNSLQPFPSLPPDFFQVFGLEPILDLDETLLRNSFYQLSKATHPDAFVLKDSLQQMNAARWSTLINRAYQTLRDPLSRTDHLLETLSDQKSTQKNIPTELAESYFELQEGLGTDQAEELLAAFSKRLDAEEDTCKNEWKEIAAAWPQKINRESLITRLRTCSDKQKYLASLRAQLEKHRGNL